MLDFFRYCVNWMCIVVNFVFNCNKSILLFLDKNEIILYNSLIIIVIIIII